MLFRASELVIKTFKDSGDEYLAFRNPANPQLVDEARKEGVAEWQEKEEEDTIE